MKIFKKIGKIALIILGSLLALVLLVWLALFLGKYAIYPDFFAEREKEFQIPGIHDGYVPQGLATVDAEGSAFMLSGYNGEYIDLYYKDMESGDAKRVIPVDGEGNTLKGHGGGVTVNQDFVYVADDSSLLVFSLAEIKAAEDGGDVVCHGKIPVDNQASFCFSNEYYLYVGEFYRPVDYETDHSHYYTTPAGELNCAIISCYLLNEDGSLAEEYPVYSISIPSQVQGFAVKDNKLMISRSWGLETATLEFYDGMRDSGTTISVSGREVPLYYLDSSNLTKTVKLPCFSEELCVVGDRVYISFESACDKYILGKPFFATYIASYPIGE
ncbi:MAG: hypothetical protein IJX19_04340 [Clostridia bacterium]|nr:hypothetical protein [Clostridia bacterium]